MGRARPPRVSGVALIDKPAGMTSHDVVQVVRRGLGQRQVGHTGTLDPAATGLMVVTLGRATRIGRFLEATDKVYEGTVRLGRSTTTWDAEGETVEAVEPPTGLDPARVLAVLTGLTGEIEQVVPVFSAVRVEGERLHARARRGEATVGPRRRVRVHRLELLGLDGPDLRLRCEVEKGTYIRSLAVDIGKQLGFPSHLASLRRIRVGPHDIDGASPPERFAEASPPILDSAQALGHLPALELAPAQVRDVGFGRPLRTEGRVPPGWVRLLGPDGTLLAVASAPGRDGRALDYEVVLIRPVEGPGTV